MSNLEGFPTQKAAGSLAQEMDHAWWEAEQPKPASAVTVQELEQLCQAYADQRVKTEAAKDIAKEENRKEEKLEKQILSYLVEMKRDNFPFQGGLIYRTRKRSWKLPSGDLDRGAFFAALRSEGVFDGMITVNSNTFNAFLKEKFEKAEEIGQSAGFSYPGVGEPAIFENISFKKGK